MQLRFLFTLIILYTFQIYGQVYEMPGNPYINNFTSEQFNFDPKIWSITENNDGEMYFGSPEGLIKFDGSRWENYTAQADPNILCVHNSSEDIIYSSGYGNFGYWEKDIYGDLKYIPIFENYGEENQGFWRIEEDDENIYFQSSIFIYTYNKRDKALNTTSAPELFLFMFKSDDRIFISDKTEGLLELKNNKLQKIFGLDLIDNVIMGGVVDSTSIKLFTGDQGVFELKEGKLNAVDWEVNNEFKLYSIFTVKEFGDGDLYVGTIRNGIYILSSDGEVKFHANKEKGIYNNTILSLFKDSNKDLWLGIDGGISNLEINSSINYIFDVHEDFGSVYTSLLKDSILYLGTNQGLFAKNINKKDIPSELIEGSQGQVWLIEEIDDEIFVGHHKGAFVLKNKKLESFGEQAGTWIFRKDSKHKDVLYAGNYSGISIYTKVNEKWKFHKRIENFVESSRFIEFDKYNQLWVAHPTHGYHRIKFSENGLDIEYKNTYHNESNILGVSTKLSLIDGDVVFYSTTEFFYYNPIEDSFVQSEYSNKMFNGITGIESIKQYGDIFWYLTSNSIGYVKRTGNKFERVQEIFSNIGTYNKGDFTHISKLSDKTYGINIDSGIAIYKEQSENKKDTLQAPKFRLIQFISSKDTVQMALGGNSNISIPYGNNYAHFLFTAPDLKVGSTYRIEYFMEGISRSWTKSKSSMVSDFPALPPGNYILKTRLSSEDGVKSDILEYSFRIDSPWYFKPISVIMYFVLIMFSLYVVRYYYTRKILNEQVELRRIEEDKIIRQKEKLELKNLESEKELLVLKEDNYRIEIEKKNNELAASTMNNIRKNDLLNELKGDLVNYSKPNEAENKKKNIKTILKKINLEMRNNEDWLTFELHFNNAHGNFFNRLREEYPSLTSNDLKLCAYLKLNLSSKEIASLMNISTRSVEMSRYRLRKKINIHKDESLSNFIGLY